MSLLHVKVHPNIKAPVNQITGIVPDVFFFSAITARSKERGYGNIMRGLRVFDSKPNVDVFPGFMLVDAQNLFGGKSCIGISMDNIRKEEVILRQSY